MGPRDRYVVSKALGDFAALSEEQMDILVTIFSLAGLYEVPSAALIKEQILTLARSALVDRTMQFVNLMKRGIPQSHMEMFWSNMTVDEISYIFGSQMAIPAKVAVLLEPPEDLQMKPKQETCLHYLKQYVVDMDSEELEAFLLFATGSTVMPRKMTVIFTCLVGECRRPIAHTCSNTIELPATYSSCQDLKREFRRILASEYTFQMTML